jgi:chloramphenicol-sensitive protein RarD
LSTVGLFQYIAPSISFVLAVALYDEPFTRAHAVAFTCVWLALGIYTLDSFRANRGA